MAKVIFVLQRRAGLTRGQCLAQWAGQQHAAIVAKLAEASCWRPYGLIAPLSSTRHQVSSCDKIVGTHIYRREQQTVAAVGGQELSGL